MLRRKGPIGSFQFDDDRLGVGSLDAFEERPQAREPARRGSLALEGRDHILGVELAAVVERHAVAKGKAPGTIVHLLPFRRQAPDRLAVLELDQRIVDLPAGEDGVAQNRIRPMRIDVHHRRRSGDPQDRGFSEGGCAQETDGCGEELKRLHVSSRSFVTGLNRFRAEDRPFAGHLSTLVAHLTTRDNEYNTNLLHWEGR